MSIVKMPPRIPFGAEPGWVERAKTAFRDYDGFGYEGGDAKSDPEDPTRWLRCAKLGLFASVAGLRPRKYLTIAEKHFAALEAAGLPMPDREHRFVNSVSPFSGKPEVVLYSSVATINGERTNYTELLNTDAGVIALRGIFRAHYSYHMWARANGPYVLEDKMQPKQLLKITESEEPRLVMVDVGPELLNREEPKDASWLDNEARQLAAIAKMLDEPMPHGNPLKP